MKYLLRDRNIIFLFGILFLFIVAVPRIIFPDLDHGDEYSDASTLMSGENFIKFGFIKCRFLPVFEPDLDEPKGAYTHAPPLSDIINGLLRKIFKTTSLRFFRGVSLFFSLLNLSLWYLLIRKITNSYTCGILAALFYLSNPFFIYGADSLYQNAYLDFLRVLIFLVFVALAGSSCKRRGIFLCLWTLFFVTSLISYEYIIYFALFFVFYKCFFKLSKHFISWRAILILFSAPVFGFLIHFFQNVWYFESFWPAFEDLKNIAVERMLNSQDTAISLNLFTWLRYVIIRNFSLVLPFSFSAISLGTFLSCLLYSKLSAEKKNKTKISVKLLIVFFISGISWYVFFPSHSVAHAFVNFLSRHLLPVAAIGLTIFSYIVFSFMREHVSFRFCFAIWAMLLIGAASAGIVKSSLPITPEKLNLAQDFSVFKKCLLQLKDISKEKDKVGVNYFRYPFIRYYTQRQCIVSFDKLSVERLSKLPKYFIFIPYNTAADQELYTFLNQKYVRLFSCESIRFPSIFFELKE